MNDQNHGGVGGNESTRTQSGHRAPSDTLDPMYHGGRLASVDADADSTRMPKSA
jgi:hypothetical protein